MCPALPDPRRSDLTVHNHRRAEAGKPNSDLKKRVGIVGFGHTPLCGIGKVNPGNCGLSYELVTDGRPDCGVIGDQRIKGRVHDVFGGRKIGLR